MAVASRMMPSGGTSVSMSRGSSQRSGLERRQKAMSQATSKRTVLPVVLALMMKARAQQCGYQAASAWR